MIEFVRRFVMVIMWVGIFYVSGTQLDRGDPTSGLLFVFMLVMGFVIHLVLGWLLNPLTNKKKAARQEPKV